MERLGTLPFVAQPGETFVYGYNTDILGCVVEKASGMPLDDFVRTRITARLSCGLRNLYAGVVENAFKRPMTSSLVPPRAGIATNESAIIRATVRHGA